VVQPTTVRLLPGRQRELRAGRRWVYRGELAAAGGSARPGDVVDVLDSGGSFVARGWYNPRSQLAVRIVTEDPGEAVDAALVEGRLDRALAYRERVLAADERAACRVVFAEADGLPGLILDRLGPVAVVQSLCLGLDPWQPLVVDWALRRLGVEAVYERNEGRTRSLEGLPQRRGVVAGRMPPEVLLSEGPLSLRVDVRRGQKTGHFLDQRRNRLALGGLAAGRATVLDAFCHTGGFGLQAAAAGAGEVLLLDQDADALALARENAARNGLSGRVSALRGNAFDLLRGFDREGRRFDCVVLDPPAFAKSRAALDGAYRGYKEINLRALRLLRPGGLLCTSSCSQPVTDEMFGEMLRDAAADAGRRLRVVARRGAPPDHPGLLGAAETLYLKCWFVEVV
jgi:23S rRNA (cytosine1962-C5)-methyltransferase